MDLSHSCVTSSKSHCVINENQLTLSCPPGIANINVTWNWGCHFIQTKYILYIHFRVRASATVRKPKPTSDHTKLCPCVNSVYVHWFYTIHQIRLHLLSFICLGFFFGNFFHSDSHVLDFSVPTLLASVSEEQYVRYRSYGKNSVMLLPQEHNSNISRRPSTFCLQKQHQPC